MVSYCSVGYAGVWYTGRRWSFQQPGPVSGRRSRKRGALHTTDSQTSAHPGTPGCEWSGRRTHTDQLITYQITHIQGTTRKTMCVCVRAVCICASVCMRAGIHAKSGSLNLCLWTLVKWTNHTSAIQITHRKNDETHWNGVWPLRLNSTQCNILNLCECPWSKMWIHNKSNQVFHAVKGWWTSS